MWSTLASVQALRQANALRSDRILVAQKMRFSRAAAQLPPCIGQKEKLKRKAGELMKVTVELIARLLELERCLHSCVRQQALTAAELDSAKENIALVRELIPNSVLTRYEQMKITEVELLDCPHAFAVAVLLSSYRQAPSVGAKRPTPCRVRGRVIPSSQFQLPPWGKKRGSWAMHNSQAKRRSS